MNQLQPKEGLTVMYIDDDPDDQQAFRDAVNDSCPQVKLSTFYNAEGAFPVLLKNPPDIVFVDLDMPGKDGLKCILEIRQHKGLQKIPIIVYSSTSRHSNIQAAYEIGANLFVTKPHTFGRLKDILCQVFSLDWSQPEDITQAHQSNFYYRAFNLE
jgi:response regulator RpfG family c-di-GMP phosphodiesterase